MHNALSSKVLCTIFRAGNTSSESRDDILGDPVKFKSYFQVIVPLLMECWVEAGPAQMNVGQKGGATFSVQIRTFYRVLS